MREILFKARRLDSGEWVEGFLVKRDAIDEWYILRDIYEQITMGHRYLRSDFNTYAFRIDPSTICQYIGLKDENGNKIFEGDIFHAVRGCGGLGDFIVEWQEEYAGFSPFSDYDCDCGIYTKASDGFVIGNIHDDEEKE